VNIEELEAAALRLDPRGRARLAERLLESLENLSPEENARIWAEEAQRRAAALDSGALSSRPADEVFRDAQRRI
jgi:hypothetical protein